MDRWLTRITKTVTVGGDLVVTLRWWPPTESEGFLPEFGETGGKVEVDPNGWWDN